MAAASIVAVPAGSQAARIFVSQAENASDDNPGTRQLPLRSLGLAIELAEPGDLVFVLSGDFRQEDTGFEPGVIPIVNKQGVRVVADRLGMATVGKFLIQNSQQVEVRGFRLRGVDFATRYPDWVDMPTIVRTGMAEPRPDFLLDFSTRSGLIEQEFATYFHIVEDLNFSSAIDIEGCDDVKILSNDIEGYWSGIQCRSTRNAQIGRNTIHHTVNGIFTLGPGPALVGGDIWGNQITQSLDNGIDIRDQSSGVIVRSNRVVFSGRSHISLLNGVRDSQVFGNRVLFGGYYSETMEFPGSSAISVNTSLDQIVIANNRIARQVDLTGVDGNGIILDFQLGNRVSVVRNVVTRCAGAGLNTTASPNADIRRNHFEGCGFRATEPRRGAGIKLSRESDINQLIVNNLFLSNRSAAILTPGNLSLQRRIDLNMYMTSGEPLIWDGEGPEQNLYETLEEVQQGTGWERNGFWQPLE